MYMQKVFEALGEALSSKDALISYYKGENQRLQQEVDRLKVLLDKKGEDEE